MTSAENSSLIQGIVSGKVQTAGNSTWNIPIWVTYVKKSNGQSDWDTAFTPLSLIENANQFYTNGLHFYLCGISYINNDDWYELSLQERLALQSYADSLNPEYNKGYINVFLVKSVSSATASYGGLGYRPVGPDHGHVIIALTGNYGNILAHELGHYFGLEHTNAFGPTPQPSSPQNAQYVHHPTDPEGHPVLLNNGVNTIYYTCWQTGDYICDTPADPGPCSFDNCNTFNYCQDSIDPLETVLKPMYTHKKVLKAICLRCLNLKHCRHEYCAKERQKGKISKRYKPEWVE